MLLRRLRLPLDLDDHRCRCGRSLDTLGDHRAACSTVGVLQTRAKPLERAWARVCREAGGHVRTHRLLRDLNAEEARVDNDRRLEVVVSGLPVFGGAQVAVDATLVSALRRTGEARPRAHTEDGAALKDARKNKHTTYPELQHSRRCHLVTAGMEVGGRWEEEAYQFLVELAKAKAQEATPTLRGSATHSWLRRWVALLSKAAMDSFACTLVYGDADKADLWMSAEPPLGAVLGEARVAPVPSRMGPR